jgi:hypothetical protein
MFALSAVSSRNVACQATQPRHKGAKHHARSRPIKVRGAATRAAAILWWLAVQLASEHVGTRPSLLRD